MAPEVPHNDQRTEMIREASRDALLAYYNVLEGDQTAATELLDPVHSLRELGIVANMHAVRLEEVEEPVNTDRLPLPKDRTKAAEYIGGQVLNALELADDFNTPPQTLIDNWRERSEAGRQALLTEHPELLTYLVRWNIVQKLYGLLDRSEHDN